MTRALTGEEVRKSDFRQRKSCYVTVGDMTIGDMVWLFREEAVGERNMLMLERDIGSR